MTTGEQGMGAAPTAPRPTGKGTARNLYVVAVSSVAAVGGFLFGFDSGVVNGAVGALEGAFGTGSAGTGFAVASVLLGCAAGAFLAGTLADFMGRRPTMLLNAFFFLVSAFISGAAGSAGVFIAARLLGGLAIGAASVLAPMYISEVAPSRLRGRLSSLQQLAIVLGLFIVFVSNYLIAQGAGGAAATFWLEAPAWRWMFWMEAVPAAVFLVGLLLIPESPRFLVANGRQEQALRVFARISGDAEHAEQLVRQVKESLRGEHRPRLSDLIEHGGRVAPVVWVGIGLAAFQQFVGINVIFYYGAVLWEAAGMTEQAALRINLLTGFVNILSTIPTIMLVDRLGRKPLMLAGSIGMALSLGALAVLFARAGVGIDGKPVLTRAEALIGLVAANLYIVAFGISWGPVMWVLLGEMFPNRLRGAALAVSGATNWVANFAVTLTFPPLLKGAGLAGAYGLYAVAAAISLLFVLTAVRETKGKTLEQM